MEFADVIKRFSRAENFVSIIFRRFDKKDILEEPYYEFRTILIVSPKNLSVVGIECDPYSRSKCIIYKLAANLSRPLTR